jgi:uncharacterized repeat protein (TIGR03806 family)
MGHPGKTQGAWLVFVIGCAAAAACGDATSEGPALVSTPDGGGDGPAAPMPPPPPPPAPPPVQDASTDGPMRADFGLDVRPSNTTCKAPARPAPTAPVMLQQVFLNVGLVGAMVTLTRIPGETTRWFAGTLEGKIVTFPHEPALPVTPTLVADIGALSGMTVNTDGEGGLLGMAFHPKFASNGYLYVSWTARAANASGMVSVVSRITSHDNGATWGEHKIILGPFDQPATNHKGGGVHFGTDGLLYLSFGDGGGEGDTFDKGQTTTGFFSKILRIDVDNPPPGAAYGIPDGNPWKAGGGEPATWAYGFRNPFRFSIDRATGDVWVGDVGQDLWEEVDVARAGGNYGWPCREGAHDYRPDVCPPGTPLVEPIFEYGHMGAYAAIIGGPIYRGSQIPGFVGSYLYMNFENSAWAVTWDPATGAPSSTVIDAGNANIVDWAEDEAGEIYALHFGGEFFKVVPAPIGPPTPFPDTLSKTGCVDPADATKPAAGLVPYDVNSPFWSDGADKERWMALPDGTTISVSANGHFDLPNGTVLVKTFRLGGKRIETRLLVHHDDGVWAGYDYEWNDAQTDATLLPSSKAKTIGTQTWRFPARADCVGCHTQAAGRSLGLEIGQLNGDYTYTATNRVSNQLATLQHIGMFSAPLAAPPAMLEAFPSPSGAAALDARARSYLHANCSHCHRPTGPPPVNLDLRFDTALSMTNTCGVTPERGDLGVTGAKIIAPGAPALSVLSLRPHAVGAYRMPPIASTVVDTKGTTLLDAWISGLAACP